MSIDECYMNLAAKIVRPVIEAYKESLAYDLINGTITAKTYEDLLLSPYYQALTMDNGERIIAMCNRK